MNIGYTIEQDEDGIWCASAALAPRVWANGAGPTSEAAIADLKEAIRLVLASLAARGTEVKVLEIA